MALADDLAAREADRLQRIRPWLDRTTTLVRGRLADAEAHAQRALTLALKDTPDGRATRGKAIASPSYQAALARLDELTVGLVALVRKARVAFYREAFAWWVPRVPAALHVRPDPAPTKRGARRFATTLLHGTDLKTEVGTPVRRAAAQLLPALTLAGRRNATRAGSADLIRAWRSRTEGPILSAMRLALSDSQMAAETRAGRDVIHPDYIDDIPIEMGA